MSTCLIDRTLSYLPVNPEFVQKEQLLKYINSIFDCGADYVEINSDVLKILDGEDLSERYIFRIITVDDMKLSLNYKFAYISMHSGFAPFFSRLSKSNDIIAEINADEYYSVAALLDFKSNNDLKNISMIQLTGVISTSIESTSSLLSWYKHNFHIPLAVCPTNTMLSGSGDAINFCNEKADAITLSFGRNHYYTSFEDFLVNRQILRESPMPKEVIAAVCTASLAFMRVFASLPCGMERIAFKDNVTAAPVYDIEKGIVFRPYKPVKAKKYNSTTVIERQIKTIGLEREIEDAIIDMLKETNFSFYQNIIKRNIID